MNHFDIHFYCTFINGKQFLVIPDTEATWEAMDWLEMKGWTLIWDSAPSKVAGQRYAHQFYGTTLYVDRPVSEC